MAACFFGNNNVLLIDLGLSRGGFSECHEEVGGGGDGIVLFADDRKRPVIRIYR